MQNNVVPLKAGDDPLDDAAQWLAKMDRGLSSDEEQELHGWLHESEQNRTMLLKMAKLWDNMAALERLKILFPEPPVKQTNGGILSSVAQRPLAMAASFLMVGVVLAFVLSSSLFNVFAPQQLVVLSQQQFETGIGDLKRISLSDGSQLTVNTNSSVEVTFTESQRVVELHKGELHIQVAHNPRRPLTVFAGGQVIQAVGTAFNVELRSEQVELIVTEGKVLVAKQNQSTLSPESVDEVHLPAQTPALVQGQKSMLGQQTLKINQVDTGDMQAQLSWHSGNLVFRGESLEQVLQEVSRYNAVSFEVSDPALYDTRVAGLFKTNDLNGFLQALEQNFAISNERMTHNRILLQTQS